MNDPLPDEDLSELFARQRSTDHEKAPTFSMLSARAQRIEAPVPAPVSTIWRWTLTGAAAFGLGLAAMLTFRQEPEPPGVPHRTVVRELEDIDDALQKSLAAQNSVTAWQSPTDFLLNPNRN